MIKQGVAGMLVKKWFISPVNRMGLYKITGLIFTHFLPFLDNNRVSVVGQMTTLPQVLTLIRQIVLPRVEYN